MLGKVESVGDWNAWGCSMWSWRSAWTGGGRGEETVGCEEEFGLVEEGVEVGEEVRVEVSLERLDEGGEVGGLVRHFCLEVEGSEDLDLEEVELGRGGWRRV